MQLYQEWQNKMEDNQQSGANREFFQRYLAKEAEAYEEILGSEQKQIVGVVRACRTLWNGSVTFIGFLDGINTSLSQELQLEDLNEDSSIDIAIDYGKLYYNMLKAS